MFIFKLRFTLVHSPNPLHKINVLEMGSNLCIEESGDIEELLLIGP
jgi:hypothetical protein